MPKFLDTPQWYGSNGTLLKAWENDTSASGKVLYGPSSSGGAPWWGNQHCGSVNGSTQAALPVYAPTASGATGRLCVWGTNNKPVWFLGGASGSVLTSGGDGALPTWRAPIYLHQVIISSICANVNFDQWISINVFSSLSTEVTTVNTLYTILEDAYSIPHTSTSVMFPASGYIWTNTFGNRVISIGGMKINSSGVQTLTFYTNTNGTNSYANFCQSGEGDSVPSSSKWFYTIGEMSFPVYSDTVIAF